MRYCKMALMKIFKFKSYPSTGFRNDFKRNRWSFFFFQLIIIKTTDGLHIFTKTANEVTGHTTNIWPVRSFAILTPNSRLSRYTTFVKCPVFNVNVFLPYEWLTLSLYQCSTGSQLFTTMFGIEFHEQNKFSPLGELFRFGTLVPRDERICQK